MHLLNLGMAGNQVLEWTDLDDEIKTAGVKDVSPYLSPRELNLTVR